MSKKIYLIIFILMIAVACTRKALPVITDRKSDPPFAKPVLDVNPDMEKGKIIFANRCARCHDLPKPEQFTAQRWDGILSYMIPRARLNDEQGIHVTAYLKANAQK